jgi:hypothetical protein
MLASKWPQVIAREILNLRQNGKMHVNFPTSREYRIYLYKNAVLGMGYYWGTKDPFGELTANEIDTISTLAGEASKRLKTPLVCVDVGQLEDNTWRVIEVGDPQHSGIAHMPKHFYWQRLDTALKRETQKADK